MAENDVHHYHHQEVEEVVKIEQNSRGFNVETRASTPERALELYDKTRTELDKRIAETEKKK